MTVYLAYLNAPFLCKNTLDTASEHNCHEMLWNALWPFCLPTQHHGEEEHITPIQKIVEN